MNARLIYNPAARRAPGSEWLASAATLVPGWTIDVCPTEGPGHATHLAAGAATAGCEAVVACGGDGTVNEVVNGLSGTPTALAIVRGGTANVWGKEIRVPKDPTKALRILETGEIRTVDLGRANDRYFICMAGAGFDAEVVRQQSASALKKRVGAAAYVLTGLRLALRWQSVTSDLSIDGETSTSEVFWLMVANTRNYGGVLNIAHIAQADDGAIDMLLLRRGGLLRLARLLPLVLLKRHHRSQLVDYRSVRSLEVRTPGMPVQVDGEYIGESPVRFEVVPAALRVVVPRGLNSPLFTSDPL